MRRAAFEAKSTLRLPQAEINRETLMKNILLAIGICSELVFAPMVAFADDTSAPKIEMKMEKPKATQHHYNRNTAKHKRRSPQIERHMDRPADAPK
jgi:hypothetical protein